MWPKKSVELPKEGFEGSGQSVVNLLRDAPHPNAAKLFLNWLLSKEGQTIYSQAVGAPSARLDVSAEGLVYPRPEAGVKYIRTDTEEAILGLAGDREVILKIFAPLKQ